MYMKNNYMCQILVFAVLLIFVSAQTAEPYDQLASHWFQKCQNQTKSTQVFDKLYSDAVEFKRYLKYAFKFIPEEKRNFCNNERDALLKRIKELSNDMKPCLAPSESYLSDFVEKSFGEFLHFLCHNDGENIDTYFHKNAAECRAALLDSTNPHLANCFGKLLKPSAGVLPKKGLCTDLSMVKTCFAETLTQQCPSYGAYKKLNEEFFKYVSKPCSACAFFTNSALLLISLIASYLFSR